MSALDSQLYINHVTRKALGLVVLKQGQDATSSDGLADKVLVEWIRANHSDVWTFVEQEQDRLKQFRDQIRPKQPEKGQK